MNPIHFVDLDRGVAKSGAAHLVRVCFIGNVRRDNAGDQTAPTAHGNGFALGAWQAERAMIMIEESVSVAGCNFDRPMFDAVKSCWNQTNLISVRIGEILSLGLTGPGDDQALISARRCRRQGIPGMIELQDRPLMVMSMLADAAAKRQHMIKRQANLLLPKGQHGLQLMSEKTDIQAVLGDPLGVVSRHIGHFSVTLYELLYLVAGRFRKGFGLRIQRF